MPRAPFPEFPGFEGYSPRNLKYMRSLAEAWSDPRAIVPQLVALLPWGHLRVLLDQLKNREQREWYLRAAVVVWLEPQRPRASNMGLNIWQKH
jgi:DUF1016 N-terminal domain